MSDRKIVIGATRQLAEFAASASYASLPPEVVTKCKEIVLDQLGVELACARLPWSQGVLRYISRLQSNGRSSILTHGTLTCAEHAAFVSGIL